MELPDRYQVKEFLLSKTALIFLAVAAWTIPFLVLLSMFSTYSRGRAASHVVSIQPETGIVLAPALQVRDTYASGGYSVQYNGPKASISDDQCSQIQVKRNVSIISDELPKGEYRILTRLAAPQDTQPSVLIQVDDATNTCVVSVLTMISTKDSTTGWDWAIDTLTIPKNGIYTIKIAGGENGVRVDRVILTDDLKCEPKETGDNCAGVTAVSPTPSMSK